MPHSTPGEIIERASAISASLEPLKSPDTTNVYVQSKSPISPGKDLEDGALRAGPAPSIWSKSYMAVLLQYGGNGILYSIMYNIVYPFLNNYLRMSGYVTASAYVLIALPYTLKFCVGIIIDCCPIWGYRRRPYMVIGMVVCAVCCIAMACMPVGDPYYPVYDWVQVTEDELTEVQRSQLNYDAPNSGTKWVILMVIANMALLFNWTAVGGVIVEISQREPENVRGTLQSLIWVARDIGGIIAATIIGFGLNSEDFGGTFSGSMGVNGVWAVCALVSLVTGAAAWYFIEEELAERRSMRKEVANLFHLVQTRVVYQVLAFLFFLNMFSSVSVTAASPIASVWAVVTPLANNIATIVGYGISMTSLILISQYGLQWSWRCMVIWGQIVVVILDVIPTFLTIWDVVRSQWFWLGLPLLENIPSNFSYMVGTFCVVEIMEKGNEATFYGLMLSVSSLASPFATVITKNIDAHFDIDTSDLQVDDTHVRWQVTWAYIIAYAFKLFSIVFVMLLPRQKAECQELRRTGGKSKLAGWLVVIMLTFLLFWTVLTNIMTIFPSTSCYTIAGGSGCS
ncbi:hypothetical protein DVH05_014031 [Phytophthora capsici]|nr:hypothetical protein DVH05_014031 [Phytophthora capsici]|eukprot:jgi/Phyca11/20337/fgenesh1_pg.PHYCAscaffold_62_\